MVGRDKKQWKPKLLDSREGIVLRAEVSGVKFLVKK